MVDTQAKKLKIIVLGNLDGQVEKAAALVDNVQNKKGAFDLMFCTGKFMPPTQEFVGTFQTELAGRKTMPVDTYFTDSSEYSGPLMNTGREESIPFSGNLNFLGRSGLKIIKGLRVAYVSGIDSDILGTEVWSADPSAQYLAHYFVKRDIENILEQYKRLVSETGKQGVDILLCGQWPLGISEQKRDIDLEKQVYYNSSASLRSLCHEICPRYIYSSHMDMFEKAEPYVNKAKSLTRFIALGSLAGRFKAPESKTTYIQAIEIQPIASQTTSELTASTEEQLQNRQDPFGLGENINRAVEMRLQVGKALLDKQEQAMKLSLAQKHREEKAEREATAKEGLYERDGLKVYVGGFDRRANQLDLEEFLSKFGEMMEVFFFSGEQNSSKQQDQKNVPSYAQRGGGGKRAQPYVIVEFMTEEGAQACVEENGKSNIMGKQLKINFKQKRVRQQEDKDCWFCIANPGIEKNLIISTEGEHFYLAVPKGPVVDEHFIIVPKRHIAHSLELSDAQEEELHGLKQRVIAYITAEKHMDYIVFERNMPFNFAKAAHMNIQIIALPSETDLDERVRGLLNGFAKNQNLKFVEITDREADLRSELSNDPTKHFFYLEVPGLKTAKGRMKTRFYCEIGPRSSFDLQLGRVLACHLLGARDRLNWKKCVLEKEEETKLVKNFREVFK